MALYLKIKSKLTHSPLLPLLLLFQELSPSQSSLCLLVLELLEPF